MFDTVADRYALLPQQERSSGTATVVVKAIDMRSPDGRHVAVKLIPRTDADDTHRVLFRREVESLRRLRHPNIVSLLDYGEDEGKDSFYLVFPWLERQLPEVLPSVDDFGWDDLIERWGLPLLDALAYSHEHEVVHRDVKPSNILIDNDGTLLLADFGISTIRSRIATEATVASLASRPFAPPDLTGMSRASRDVWGFAATALSCLIDGPFEDYPHLETALDDVDVPPEVEKILRECTSRDPDARPSNAIILRDLIREIHLRRTRKWMQVHKAQLIVRDEAARQLLTPPNDRDRDAIERTLQAEFAHGTHLARMVDPNTAERRVDILHLVGSQRRLRLVVIPDQPAFIVTKIYKANEGELDAARRDAWPVVEEVEWTSRDQAAATARQTKDRVLAALDAHYLQQDDLQQQRDENRMFDKWLDLLEAKEDLEAERSAPLPYHAVSVKGKQARFHLAAAPDTDVVGEERICRVRASNYGRTKVVGGIGVVIAQDDHSVTLAYKYKPANLPTAGELVLSTGASSVALSRQREAVVNVRSETSVRPQLRQLLLDPSRIAPPMLQPEMNWFDEHLDEDKRTAIAGALGCEDFYLLEGPPGTGKTSFITELVRQELRGNPDARILLVSQTHVAVDNALVRLVDAGLDNVVRLGRPDDSRVAERAQPYLLDQLMPGWVQDIRDRAEGQLEEMAHTAQVDLENVRGVAALGELIAALEEQSDLHARRAAIIDVLQQPAAPPVSRQADGDNDTSAAGQLNDSLQRLSDRISELLDRAASLLGTDALTALLPPGPVLTPATARTAFNSAVDHNPALRKLAGILRLQAEWFQRIESSRDLEAVLLRQARVVAGTCLGFLSHPAVRDLEFDLCILDEASKATATETLVPLARARRWVLVGDPHQLPPMQEEVLDHPDIMDRHGLERTDVERSLFQELLDGAPAAAHHQLTQQYRMHPSIGGLISDCFYKGSLRSAARPKLAGWDTCFHRPVAWLDTGRSAQRREERVGTGIVNHHEVRVVKQALADLRQALIAQKVRTDDGKPLRVLILTAYRKQMEELRRAIAGPSSPLLEVEVNTVDAVQGRETDVTFFSVARSNDHHSLGFLGPTYWRRVNVALSRSRYGLVIIGDAPFCEAEPGPFQDVLTHIRRHPDACWIGNARA
ncbi:Protein kinase domain-containing protein [Nonomuraea solani]|uniref:Protein kinase domain-containing protein n=1 Tax=Nonomuraea solani TaxID=1144553 RepID=A0A1H6F0A8_9ACTN|nr:AAA domain-containing protein [Nonomuraea solani]SEH02374.1 Protein kinase domain-containing protein [Nonomuraea solani]